MSKRINKVLAFVLSAVLCFAMVPAMAFAEGGEIANAQNMPDAVESVEGVESVVDSAPGDVQAPSNPEKAVVEEQVIDSDEQDAHEEGLPGLVEPDDGIALATSVAAGPQLVADGFYNIFLFKSDDLTLDVADGSADDRAGLQLGNSDGSYAQLFELEYVDGFYKVINVNSGKLLTLDQENASSGAVACQMADANDDSQLWLISKSGSNTYTLTNKASGLVLGVTDKTAVDGSAVKGLSDDDAAAQRWVFAEQDSPRETLDKLAAEHADALKVGETYIIQSALASKQVLDVTGASQDDFANVQLYQSNMTGAQKWTVEKDANGYLTFINVSSGKALDVNGANKAAGTNVQQYKSNGTYAQKWIVIQQVDGYKIASALWPGVCLDIADAKSANGTNVQIWRDNGTAAQRFSFFVASPQVEPCSEVSAIQDGEWYQIGTVLDEDYALDVQGASTVDGASIQLYQANDTHAQFFKFVYEDGYYRILNARSGKAFDVVGGNVVPPTAVQQWAYSSVDPNQQFAIIENEDGTISFVNRATGLALEVHNGAVSSGAVVQCCVPNDSDAQKFVLKKQVNLLKEGLFTVDAFTSSSKVVDVRGGSTSDGAVVQLYSPNGTPAQKWYVQLVSGVDNTYTLQSVVSGKLLTADAQGNVIQLAREEGNALQHWVPSLVDGTVVLKNAASGQALDYKSTSATDSTALCTSESDGAQTQRFYLKATSPLQPGTYFVQFEANKSQVLDVADGSLEDWANVQVCVNTDSGAQKWNAQLNADGTYTFTNAQSEKALDVLSGEAFHGANVQQYKSNGTAAQKWHITYDPELAGFRIASAADPSFVLSAQGGALATGTNVQLESDVASKTQRFTFEKTEYIPPMLPHEQALYDKAQGYSSLTNWLLLVDTTNNWVGIFYGKQGAWDLQAAWRCSSGAPGTPTVIGEYTVGIKGYSFGSGYTCYYYTQFRGNYLFHSVLYHQGTFKIKDGRLGQNLSHGCVRMDISHAKWIYDNIPRYTKVVTYR